LCKAYNKLPHCEPYLCTMDSCGKYKWMLLFALLVANELPIFAQIIGPPEIGCTQVFANGNIAVNWGPVTDPSGDFVQYNLYGATQPTGPFALIGSENNTIDIAHTDATILGNAGPLYYYLTTTDTFGESIGSDTISSIHLSVLPSTLPMGFANLDWNAPYSNGTEVPLGLEYEVWKEYPTGVWTMVGTLPYGVTSWNYEIQHCNTFLTFQIRLNVPNGCSFVSNFASDTFGDFQPPVVPNITSISINHTTNDAEVTWDESFSADCIGYLVYECDGSNVYFLDTIHGRQNTQFTDFLVNPALGPTCYLLAAFDSCFSGFPPSPNTSTTADICNCSVYLPNIPYAICDDQVTLEWTPYVGWAFGVSYYNIYHASTPDITIPFNTLSFELVEQVTGAQLYADHFDFDINAYNVYYIEAVDTIHNHSALSNLQAVFTPYPIPPDHVYLASASVFDDQMIEVKVATGLTNDPHDYALQRKDINGGNWEDIITIQGQATNEVVLTDVLVSADVFSYTYRVICENLCGDVVDTTLNGTTILGNGLADPNRLVNTIVWSPYSQWEVGVSNYKVYRTIGRDGPEELLATLSNTARNYEDDVADLSLTEGEFCYRIEAVEATNVILDTAFTARSNVVCLSQKPVIWIPNAFVIDGFNSTFSPDISFADFQEFNMVIMSRWGDIIYETNDYTQPWDGTMNGVTVQEGSYIYYISVKDGKGQLFEFRGFVMMLVNREK
jgi:gliding motility-associated-like protein